MRARKPGCGGSVAGHADRENGGAGGASPEGGCTRFHVTRAAPGGRHAVALVDVAPEAGLALVHDHNILHEGCPTRGGSVKYVIRTDIMFEGRSSARRGRVNAGQAGAASA